MLRIALSFLAFVCLVAILSDSTQAQKRSVKRKSQPKPPASESIPVETVKSEPIPEAPSKRNARTEVVTPSDTSSPVQIQKRYTYEFSQPNFVNSHIKIEHDSNGTGEIRFTRKDFGEEITEKIELGPTVLKIIDDSLAGLDFLNSSEDYQHKKDFSHLGNSKFSLVDGRSQRTIQFNYTDNKFVKALADEYRKIGNKYIWMFDIGVARENRPLDAPKLMTVLDGFLRRGEIADPPQMVDFLTELSNDERIPLIARNHADRLVKQIEKEALRSRK